MKGKKSVKLFVTWVISLLVVGVPTGIYATAYAVIHDLSEPTVPLWYLVTLAAVILLYFLPLLGATVHHAIKEKQKAIGIIAAILFVHNLLCLLGELISWFI